jgi:uncharacterized protein (TIGR03084 family)
MSEQLTWPRTARRETPPAAAPGTSHDVLAALNADADDFDGMLSSLAADRWSTPTPAPGWTVAHQVAHLAATFRMVWLAVGDPEAFKAVAARVRTDFEGAVRSALAGYLAEPPDVLFAHWRDERGTASDALATVPPDQMVTWLVRPLPAPVLAAAGMMELFGHGQDIADALGLQRRHTDRIRPMVEFAVRVWDFGYQARQLPVPEVEFRFELTAPSGAAWTFGPADSVERVSGPAVDFCLLVTRRRHHADLALTAAGAEATRWLDLAQAYRGPAGPGRQPGQFSAGPS